MICSAWTAAEEAVISVLPGMRLLANSPKSHFSSRDPQLEYYSSTNDNCQYLGL